MHHPLDRILVASFLQTRDEGLFRLLYRRHHGALWRLALRLCEGDTAAADDIVQDAWIRAVERLPTFQWRSALRTWLAGIVVFRWREDLRRKKLEQTYFAPIDQGLFVAANTPEPATQMDVVTALEQLPKGYRTLLVLHDLEGYRHEDIADMLGIAVGTCKSQLHHARKAFRALNP